MFTTAGFTRSNMGARLGNPCPPAGQGSAAAAAPLEYNAQTMTIVANAIITGLQTGLRGDTGCLSTAGIIFFLLSNLRYAAGPTALARLLSFIKEGFDKDDKTFHIID
jgi:hypothetical protein